MDFSEKLFTFAAQINDLSTNLAQDHPTMSSFISRCIDVFTQKYEWLMSLILKAHHVQVSREKYVRQLVKLFYGKQPTDVQDEMIRKAMEGSLPDILDPSQQQKAYSSLRWHYGWIVFWVSFFMTTVPDNVWVIIVSCAIDLYVFQCMVFRAMQKIMMLYGQPLDMNADTDAGVETILSVDRSGVMVGKYPLLQKLKSGLGFAAKQMVQRQGPKVVAKMSRSAFMVIRRQCIKWFSVIVAKQQVSFVFDLLIPLTCALISGLVSVIILVPMCNKLQKSILRKG